MRAEELYEEFKRLVDEADKVIYKPKIYKYQGRLKCGYCEMIAIEIAEKYNIPLKDALQVIDDLTSTDTDKALKAEKKLKEWGVYNYVKKRSREILKLLNSITRLRFHTK